MRELEGYVRSSGGKHDLPVYIMDETLVTCWNPMAVETIWRDLAAVVRRTLESEVERISSRRKSKACKISGFKETNVLDLNFVP